MKNLKKMSLMAALVAVGVGGLAASGNAQPWHQERVIVKETRVIHHGKPSYGPRGSLFNRLDINNNREVSRWEFEQRYGGGRTASRVFNRVDRNDSGKLSMQEVARGADMLKDLRMRG